MRPAAIASLPRKGTPDRRGRSRAGGLTGLKVLTSPSSASSTVDNPAKRSPVDKLDEHPQGPGAPTLRTAANFDATTVKNRPDLHGGGIKLHADVDKSRSSWLAARPVRARPRLTGRRRGGSGRSHHRMGRRRGRRRVEARPPRRGRRRRPGRVSPRAARRPPSSAPRAAPSPPPRR